MAYLLLNFLKLEYNNLIRFIPFSVKIRQNLQRLILTAKPINDWDFTIAYYNTHRPLSNNQRGLSGKKSIPVLRMIAGIICNPQGIRKEATPLMYEQPN